MSIRILLADDHQILREELRALIQQEPEMEVVAEAENGRQAVELARELKPDLVIMDVGMPVLNGMEATRQISSENTGLRIIALSIHSDPRYVEEMLKAGATGYLLKQRAFSELILAIRAVMADESFLSPGVTQILIQDYIKSLSASQGSPFAVLSPREREIVQLLAEGFSAKKIASQLHVSTKTVDTHRQNIMRKLNLSSVADLVKYAIREGLTHLES